MATSRPPADPRPGEVWRSLGFLDRTCRAMIVLILPSSEDQRALAPPAPDDVEVLVLDPGSYDFAGFQRLPLRGNVNWERIA